MDEYKAVTNQMGHIIDGRMAITNNLHEWDYNKEVGKLLQAQPYKYQSVEMSSKVEFTDDIRKLIYNQKAFPEDFKLFSSSEWQLAPVNEKVITPPTVIPSNQYLRSKNKEAEREELDTFFGKMELEGRIKGKSNELNYNNYYFNLRSNALIIYKSESIDAGEKQLFYITLSENTYDYHSNATEYILLKGEQKNFKIFKEQSSYELIKKLEKKLLLYSFRGAYALRNQIPSWRVEDYLHEEIDTIGPIHFHQQTAIKDITSNKYYRETIGAFLKLLQIYSRQRKNIAGEIFYPRWLTEQFRDLPLMQTWLSTNVIPPQHPLMSLKIKVNNNEKQGLLHSLKYIFPYIKTYVKRSLVLYESELSDDEMVRTLENINFPMFSICFPNNNLSQKALQYAIQKSSDLYNEILDFSYNSRLLTLGGSKTLNMINNNPTIKKLYLKGCQVSNEEQDAFFDALSSNLCLFELQINYNETYNENLVEFLDDFEAIFE